MCERIFMYMYVCTCVYMLCLVALTSVYVHLFIVTYTQRTPNLVPMRLLLNQDILWVLCVQQKIIIITKVETFVPLVT